MGRPRGKKHGGVSASWSQGALLINQSQRGGARAPQTRDNGAGEWKVFSPADYKNEAFEAYYKVSLIYCCKSYIS